MQRILYCTDSLMAGGTEQQLVELVTRLDRTRFAPTVVCLYGGRTGRSLHFLPRLRECGIPVIVLDLEQNPGGKLRGVFEIIRCVRQIKPDIVQAVNYHSNLLMRLARPFLAGSLRLVGCVYVEYTAKQLLYERLSGWLCDAVVCNSTQLARQLRAVAPRSVEVIPNGIDIERFAGVNDRSRRDHLSRGARRVLLFMGRISSQKSPHLLAEALAILKRDGALPADVAVWIVGEIEDAAEQKRLDDVMDRGDLRDVIAQFPATAAPEVTLAAADVLVLPSLWEGLPNVVLEVLAAGRPAVVSEAANAAGLIEHGVNGWVFPTGDAARLAKILCMVLGLPDEDLSSMRTACQRTAAPFAVETMVRRYQALYERLSVCS